MPTANLYEVEFGSPQGIVSMAFTYDTASLIVQGLTYNNPSPLPGTLTMSGPANDSITMPANANATVSLASANIVCVQQQVTDKFGTHTVTSLPGGEVLQFTWPT